MCKIYEQEVNGINAKYVEEVSKFIHGIMNFNKEFSEKLQQFYVNIHSSEVELSKHFHLNDKKQTKDDLALLQVNFLL